MGTAFEKNLRQPPPRHVNPFTQMTMLLSGLYQQMGWLFLGMGMIAVVVFLPLSDWNYFFVRGPWKVIPGVIVAAERSSPDGKNLVWEYGHKFYLHGVEYTGRSFGYEGDFRVGQKVRIKVNLRNPSISKVEGARTGPFPKYIIFIALIFPLIGAGLIIPSLRSQAKSIDLLKNGTFTRGKLREKTPTGEVVKINNQRYPVYKFLFEFEYQGASYLAECKTHETGPLQDEEQETIVFYPDNPTLNVVYDSIPNAPEIDAKGNFIQADWTAVRFLVLPAFGLFMPVLVVVFLL